MQIQFEPYIIPQIGQIMNGLALDFWDSTELLDKELCGVAAAVVGVFLALAPGVAPGVVFTAEDGVPAAEDGVPAAEDGVPGLPLAAGDGAGVAFSWAIFRFSINFIASSNWLWRDFTVGSWTFSLGTARLISLWTE